MCTDILYKTFSISITDIKSYIHTWVFNHGIRPYKLWLQTNGEVHEYHRNASITQSLEISEHDVQLKQELCAQIYINIFNSKICLTITALVTFQNILLKVIYNPAGGNNIPLTLYDTINSDLALISNVYWKQAIVLAFELIQTEREVTHVYMCIYMLFFFKGTFHNWQNYFSVL